MRVEWNSNWDLLPTAKTPSMAIKASWEKHPWLVMCRFDGIDQKGLRPRSFERGLKSEAV